MLFRGYRFEHRNTERTIVIRGRSYLWAGLFGAGYVWWIGFGSILHALAVNVGIAVAVVFVALASSILAPSQQLMVLIALLPVAGCFQAMTMVSIVKTGFRRRGWLSRPA